MKKIFISVLLFLLVLPVNISAQISFDDVHASDLGTEMDNVKEKIAQVLGFVRWVGVAIGLIMGIYCAVKLSASAGNPQKRQMAMDGLKNVFIGMAIIGGLTVISSIAYGILKG